MPKLKLSVRKSWLNGPMPNSTLPLLSVLLIVPLVLILSLRVLPSSLLRSIPDQLSLLKVEMFPALVLTR